MLKPLLIGEFVKLTALSKDDAPIITSWYQDPYFARLFDANISMPPTQQKWADFIDNIPKESPYSMPFAIRLVRSSELVGVIMLDGIAWNHGNSFFAIGIDPKQQGKGYGTEALKLLIEFAFNELNLHRLILTVFSYNLHAVAMYEKLGFRHEGTFREHLHRDGQRYDMYLYGLLRREWEA